MLKTTKEMQRNKQPNSVVNIEDEDVVCRFVQQDKSLGSCDIMSKDKSLLEEFGQRRFSELVSVESATSSFCDTSSSRDSSSIDSEESRWSEEPGDSSSSNNKDCGFPVAFINVEKSIMSSSLSHLPQPVVGDCSISSSSQGSSVSNDLDSLEEGENIHSDVRLWSSSLERPPPCFEISFRSVSTEINMHFPPTTELESPGKQTVAMSDNDEKPKIVTEEELAEDKRCKNFLAKSMGHMFSSSKPARSKSATKAPKDAASVSSSSSKETENKEAIEVVLALPPTTREPLLVQWTHPLLSMDLSANNTKDQKGAAAGAKRAMQGFGVITKNEAKNPEFVAEDDDNKSTASDAAADPFAGTDEPNSSLMVSRELTTIHIGGSAQSIPLSCVCISKGEKCSDTGIKTKGEGSLFSGIISDFPGELSNNSSSSDIMFKKALHEQLQQEREKAEVAHAEAEALKESFRTLACEHEELLADTQNLIEENDALVSKLSEVNTLNHSLQSQKEMLVGDLEKAEYELEFHQEQSSSSRSLVSAYCANSLASHNTTNPYKGSVEGEEQSALSQFLQASSTPQNKDYSSWTQSELIIAMEGLQREMRRKTKAWENEREEMGAKFKKYQDDIENFEEMAQQSVQDLQSSKQRIMELEKENAQLKTSISNRKNDCVQCPQPMLNGATTRRQQRLSIAMGLFGDKLGGGNTRSSHGLQNQNGDLKKDSSAALKAGTTGFSTSQSENDVPNLLKGRRGGCRSESERRRRYSSY